VLHEQQMEIDQTMPMPNKENTASFNGLFFSKTSKRTFSMTLGDVENKPTKEQDLTMVTSDPSSVHR
jgi:hypothetical protein